MYKRYGPSKNAILSQKDLLLGPETSVTETWATIGEDLRARLIRQEVRSDDGTLWYTYESSQGDVYSITNHRTGKVQRGPTIPPNSCSTDQEHQSAVEILQAHGYHITGSDSFNGRRTVVLESTSPVTKQPSTGQGEGFNVPIVDDLGAVEYRVETHVDELTGNTLQYFRYAIDGTRRETLVEHFEWLDLQLKS